MLAFFTLFLFGWESAGAFTISSSNHRRGSLFRAEPPGDGRPFAANSEAQDRLDRVRANIAASKLSMGDNDGDEFDSSMAPSADAASANDDVSTDETPVPQVAAAPPSEPMMETTSESAFEEPSTEGTTSLPVPLEAQVPVSQERMPVPQPQMGETVGKDMARPRSSFPQKMSDEVLARYQSFPMEALFTENKRPVSEFDKHFTMPRSFPGAPQQENVQYQPARARATYYGEMARQNGSSMDLEFTTNKETVSESSDKNFIIPRSEMPEGTVYKRPVARDTYYGEMARENGSTMDLEFTTNKETVSESSDKNFIIPRGYGSAPVSQQQVEEQAPPEDEPVTTTAEALPPASEQPMPELKEEKVNVPRNA